jgi:SAM-dependent methyltransferase
MRPLKSIPSLLVLLGASALALGQEAPKLDVPYVPTPEPVVAKMLEMADVKAGDVVYDLGCGDGRIVIAAVRDRGAARGVGVDIDPQRIAESNENAKQAGVSDRVKFVTEDLFKMDFSEADVVAMYLLSSINERLRPTILELRPGTRIVSHAFRMGDWEPDAQAQVAESGGQNVYFWIVPAKVQGTWKWEAQTPQGKKPVELSLSQKYQIISGTAKVGDVEYALTNAKLKGDQITFMLEPTEDAQKNAAMSYRGKIEGDSINGKMFASGAAVEGGAQPAAARAGETNAQSEGTEWVAKRESAGAGENDR